MNGFFESLAWVPHVFSIEIRKLLSYRVAFWVRYVIGTLTEIVVAYFLWSSLFRQTGSTTMGGFTFHGIIFYYVFSGLVGRMIQTADQGGISSDIYEGGLTRYLLYPLSFLQYKYVSFIGQQTTMILQIFLGFGIAVLIWGIPADQTITLGSIFAGIGTAILAGSLMFLINACLELVAFWQDTVWNLMAMLRFISNLMGGLHIPLVFFPLWGQTAVRFTPFPLIYSFPIRTFLGQIGPTEWLHEAGLLLCWILGFVGVLAWIWKRGTKIYSGVGV